MFKFPWMSSAEERVLAEQLQAEARLSCPEFSEPLYARIRQAVRARQRRPAPRSARGSAWRWAYATAAAAGVLILASLAVWKFAGPPAPEPEPRHIAARPADPAVDLDLVAHKIDCTAQDLGALVESTLATHQWGRLDQDAKLAAGLVLSQLPLGPDDPKP